MRIDFGDNNNKTDALALHRLIEKEKRKLKKEAETEDAKKKDKPKEIFDPITGKRKDPRKLSVMESAILLLFGSLLLWPVFAVYFLSMVQHIKELAK
jgi:hypothetical protein